MVWPASSALRILGAAALLLAVPADRLAAQGCPDPDVDGVCSAADNCPLWPNASQANAGQSPAGDACECGDVSGDGLVSLVDVVVQSRSPVGLGPGIPTPDLHKCDIDGDGRCTILDPTALRSALVGRAALPGSACADYARVYEHVLSRAGFGPDAWSRARIASLGPAAYVGEQLVPAAIADTEYETRSAAYATGSFATSGKTITVLRSQFCNLSQTYCTDRRGPEATIVAQLSELKLLRALYSHRQLEAVLLDFWLNHFNVDGATDIAQWAMPRYEQEVLRPFVLGRFEDLLQAVTESAAMLDSLDLRRNTRTNRNENYPRELLELLTMGPTGTYDEADVQEVTRILTGYTWDANQDWIFTYVPSRHDPGTKTVTLDGSPAWVFNGTLGCAGRPSADFANEGEVLICLLARDPHTARFVTRKLIQRFVDELVPTPLHDQAIATWLATGGDLRAVLETILTSDEFLSVRHARAKIERPLVFAASALRAIGQPDLEGISQLLTQEYTSTRASNSFNGLMGDLIAMGEAPYRAAPPTGYPEASAAWASAGGSLVRWNRAYDLMYDHPTLDAHFGISSSAGPAIVDALRAALLPGGLASARRMEIARFVDQDLPGTTRLERVRKAGSLVLSTPEALLY
jgi:uncharacterized protein (DUF1800 family)